MQQINVYNSYNISIIRELLYKMIALHAFYKKINFNVNVRFLIQQFDTIMILLIVIIFTRTMIFGSNYAQHIFIIHTYITHYLTFLRERQI